MLPVPPLASYADVRAQRRRQGDVDDDGGRSRLLGNLLKDKTLGPRIVPIVADEARTFGMANLFRQVGIYSPVGQLYEPEDAGSMLYYREATDGPAARGRASPRRARSRRGWRRRRPTASHGLAMLPFYIYYSMFGFQRVGDLIWAAADQRARGFLIGATAGRTTLGGEGLQHQDGSSHLIAATVPNCRAYDPAFAGELAVIVDRGMRADAGGAGRRLLLRHGDERELRPAVAPGRRRTRASSRGMYRLRAGAATARGGSGCSARERSCGEVIEAADALEFSHGVAAEVWSVTSFSELARAGARAESAWRRGATDSVRSHVGEQLAPTRGPIIVATDYVRAVAEQIRAFLPPGRRFVTLGTDGFGRSDTRAALRRFFEVDAEAIVAAALRALG